MGCAQRALRPAPLRSQTLAPELLSRSAAALATWPTAVIFLALEEASGAPAGVATCFHGFGTFQAAPLLNVHDLAVLPAHRRRGLGRALLSACVALARDEGCGKVTLEALAENAAANTLYDSLGFSFVMRFGELRLLPGGCCGGLGKPAAAPAGAGGA